MSTTLEAMGRSARTAAAILCRLTSAEKNAALESMANALSSATDEILRANEKDLAALESQSAALRDRLLLTPTRITDASEGLRAVARLDDPVGEVLAEWKRPNGLLVRKVRVPFGIIGIVYEARPNVTVDAAGLCLKTGNAVILRGSSSALHSNRAIVAALRAGLTATAVPLDGVQLVEATDRETAREMLRMNKALDLLIPRGGADLIDYVVENATVPVIETGAGNCHVYIHHDAEPERAIGIIINAKTQRPSVCNAAEKVLVHEGWSGNLRKLVGALETAGVECRGCERTKALVPSICAADDSDWGKEYLDLVIAMKIVRDVEEAVEHINRYGTKHSEAILTEESEAVAYFMTNVDSAAVYHNASTRFTDGFEFGFGAEIGISTQKLHARGPMGLSELTSYKYLVFGSGQVR